MPLLLSSAQFRRVHRGRYKTLLLSSAKLRGMRGNNWETLLESSGTPSHQSMSDTALVLCPAYIDGYSRFSLTRASLVVNRQSMPAFLALRSRSHFAIARASNSRVSK